MIKLDQNQPLDLFSVFEEYILYCKGKGLSKKSLSGLDGTFKLLSRLGNLDLEDPYSNQLIIEYYSNIVNNYTLAINSRGTYLRQLKAFFNWVNKEYSLNIPLPYIIHEDVIKDTYSDDDLAKLIKKPKKWKNFAEYRNWLITMLLIDTGMRASTVRNIRLEDIHFKDGYIITKHNKTKKQQLVPISKTLNTEMYKYSGLVNNFEYFFPDIYGNQMSENALKLAIRKYNIERGVKITSIHAHRHTFAKRYLLEMGGDPFRLQKMLGHSTLEMTKHYAAIYDKDLLDQYELTSPLELLSKKKIKL